MLCAAAAGMAAPGAGHTHPTGSSACSPWENTIRAWSGRWAGASNRPMDSACGYWPTGPCRPAPGVHRAQLLLDHLRDEVLPVETGCDAVMGFTAADVSITKGKLRDWGLLGLPTWVAASAWLVRRIVMTGRIA